MRPSCTSRPRTRAVRSSHRGSSPRRTDQAPRLVFSTVVVADQVSRGRHRAISEQLGHLRFDLGRGWASLGRAPGELQGGALRPRNSGEEHERHRHHRGVRRSRVLGRHGSRLLLDEKRHDTLDAGEAGCIGKGRMSCSFLECERAFARPLCRHSPLRLDAVGIRPAEAETPGYGSQRPMRRVDAERPARRARLAHRVIITPGVLPELPLGCSRGGSNEPATFRCRFRR